jgi:hypothetical protein
MLCLDFASGHPWQVAVERLFNCMFVDVGTYLCFILQDHSELVQLRQKLSLDLEISKKKNKELKEIIGKSKDDLRRQNEELVSKVRDAFIVRAEWIAFIYF